MAPGGMLVPSYKLFQDEKYAKAKNQIKKAMIVLDGSLEKYGNVLGKIENVQFIDEINIMEKER